MNKTFSKDYLVNELELPETAIEDDIVDNGRWTLIHEIIFEDKDGKNYQTWYSEGATEMQDESPWEYEDNIECTLVEKKQVTVEKWVPISD